MMNRHTQRLTLSLALVAVLFTSCSERPDNRVDVPPQRAERSVSPRASVQSPVRSEDRSTAPQKISVVISEFMAANDSGATDMDGEYSDWIELKNDADQAVDLGGCYLTDDAENLSKWPLPEIRIEAGEYQVIFASGKDRSVAGSELHTNFRLQAKGDYLALIAPDGRTVIHQFAPEYPKQKSDTSFGLANDWTPDSVTTDYESYFTKPTPGAANADVLYGDVEPVKLSHTRGFYQKPFELTLSTRTADAEIRYTTDGTPPVADASQHYTSPLTIDQTTVLRVAAFKPGYRTGRAKTHTFLFPVDIVRQSPDGVPPPGFPYSWGANRVDYGMDPQVVDDPRFSDEITEGLKSLPSFSVVMDVDDLFDERTGIYANARGDGREWERPCSVEMIHADETEGFQIDCGIRIRGGFSRHAGNPKHAFRLFFRDQYGPSKLEYPLFGERGAQEFDNLDLRTSQNYSWQSGDQTATFLRDQFNRDLQAAMNQPSARGDFCHLYINGQYWGLFDTCERPEASYGSEYFGGKKSDYDVVKKGSGRGGYAIMATDGNLDAWERLYHLGQAGLADNAKYYAIQGKHPDGSVNPEGKALVDVDNLIDYMLVIFYGGNLDGPASWWMDNRYPNNWYGIRNRNGTEGFRFFIWDAEHTLLVDGPSVGVNEDRTGPFPTGEEYGSSNPQWLWQQCMQNAEFRLRAADRIYKYFYNGGLLTAASVKERFLARVAEIESAVICESARWGDASRRGSQRPLNRDDDWRKEINRTVSDYIPVRSDIVLGQLFRQGLVPDFDPPRFSQFGGPVAPGHRLQLEASKGKIFYTTDGSDPRMVGGKIADNAIEYQSSEVVIDDYTIVNARVLFEGEWSALATAEFQIADAL